MLWIVRTDAPWRDLPPEFDEEIGYRDHDTTAPRETKGFIGERYDAGACLQYLNARYYDPKLALFLQPDWFEVQERGVGTKRYSYSFNDPINNLDPSGNACAPCAIPPAIEVVKWAGAIILAAVGIKVASDSDGIPEESQQGGLSSGNPEDESDVPFGLDITGSGKVHAEHPSSEEIGRAPTSELERYLERLEEYVRQREEELERNDRKLSRRDQKGCKSRLEASRKIWIGQKSEL